MVVATEQLKALVTQAVREDRIIMAGQPVTEAELENHISLWRERQLVPREAVGLCFDNGKEVLLDYLALLLLDCVAVPLPKNMPNEEKIHLWTSLGCRFAFSNGEFQNFHRQTPPLWPEEVSWVMHSSGSTGTPKAIALSPASLMMNATNVMKIFGEPRGLKHLGLFSHCYNSGLYNGFFLPIVTQGTVIIGPLGDAIHMDEIIEIIKFTKPDILWLSPVMLKMLQHRAKNKPLSIKKAIISCTAPLRKSDCESAERQFCIPVLQSYGLTEAFIVSLEEPSRNLQTEFSAGNVIGGLGNISVEPDSSVLNIHNGSISAGYATLQNNRILLSFSGKSVPGKFFCSSDLAKIDEGGRLGLLGRTSSTIEVDGIKLSAEQLESILCSVKGIEEAAVFPYQVTDGTFRPAALIKTSIPINTATLAEACVERLGPKARPIQILSVKSIPKTTNGKMDRKMLPSIFIEAQLRYVELKKVYTIGNQLMKLDSISQIAFDFFRGFNQSQDFRLLNAALKLFDRLSLEKFDPDKLEKLKAEQQNALRFAKTLVLAT